MDIKNILKKNKWIYSVYFLSMSLIIKVLKLFVRTDDHLILFVSYGGRYFNDNPKIIYDAMMVDDRFKGYKLVWAFTNPNSIKIDTPKIKIDSLRYIIMALKARCWVTNVSIERGLNFRGRNTFYFYTTHTVLPKKCGFDCAQRIFSYYQYNYDCICAQSEVEKNIQMSAYRVRGDQIMISGYPKNDILCNYSKEKRQELRRNLNLPPNKKVILYAPTFRDAIYGSMNCPVNFKKWESVLGSDFVVLFRAHPVVANETSIDSSTGFIYDVSSYIDNADLMIASDILISDYSGIFFEYAVQDKLMFCYAYDYEDYIKTRELYFDIRKELPGGLLDEETLLKHIKEPMKEDLELVNQFREKYVTVSGHSTSLCLDKIIAEIS